MPDYSLNRALSTQQKRHVERVERLASAASTDQKAANAVYQSLDYLKEHYKDTFEELMRKPEVEEMYKKDYTKENRPSQGNSASASIQETQSREQHNLQANGSAEVNTSSKNGQQTFLLLTVGTNALPVWVAWYHLKKHLNNNLKIGFVYTHETEEMMKCLKKCFEEGGAEKANFFDTVPMKSGSLKAVGTAIETVIEDINPQQGHPIHVHYTSGTKVMGVETVFTIGKKHTNFNRSYLNPRDNPTPAIVDQQGRTIGPEDARQGICPDIKRIAELNDFRYESGESDPPCLPNIENTSELISCAETSHTWLKYIAWMALKESLKDIACSDKNRENYEVFRDVKISLKDRSSHFLLDIVAVLGYQVIVISCSSQYDENGIGKKKGPVKLEAMKAYHQAKQLGGDEARAIMLCGLDKEMATKTQNELHHDIGSEDVPLQVWGYDKWRKLKRVFDTYLKNRLRWVAAPVATDTTQKGSVEPDQPTEQEPQCSIQSSNQTWTSVSSKIENLLILTVGTNALPVWVAWHHLKERLNNNLKVGFVYTNETEKRMKCLKRRFKEGGAKEADFFDIPATSSGNLKDVGDTIQDILPNLSGNAQIHVHYTSGTKVMGVETVFTIGKKHTNFNRSYLNPRDNPTPAIVDQQGRTIGPEDARQGICPDIKRIAELHGFEVSQKQPFSPTIDPRNFASDTLCDEDREELCEALRMLSENSICNWKTFECAALAALKCALEEIKRECEGRSYKRDNYALFWNVHFRKKVDSSVSSESEDTQSNNSPPEPFELDVVAILGYQVIVVSCSLDNSRIEKKAVEAYHRAKQLGGDEARVITLCQFDDPAKRELEEKLKDYTGSRDVPLLVWGKGKWPRLSDNFKDYLQCLGWE